eukprot:3811317-Rhodomonas_salina.1
MQPEQSRGERETPDAIARPVCRTLQHEGERERERTKKTLFKSHDHLGRSLEVLEKMPSTSPQTQCKLIPGPLPSPPSSSAAPAASTLRSACCWAGGPPDPPPLSSATLRQHRSSLIATAMSVPHIYTRISPSAHNGS